MYIVKDNGRTVLTTYVMQTATRAFYELAAAGRNVQLIERSSYKTPEETVLKQSGD